MCKGERESIRKSLNDAYDGYIQVKQNETKCKKMQAESLILLYAVQ